ncbi:DUF4355 domain-containing protein [Lachnospiraceae bacterium 54-53]
MAETTSTTTTTTTEPTGSGAAAAGTIAVATDPAASGTGTQEAEQLNAFQKFLSSIGLGGSKETEDSKDSLETKPEETTETGKTYSQADLDAAIAKAQADFETRAKEKERLSKLSPEERSKAETEAKDKEVSDLKAQLLARELKETALGALSKDGFPVELAGILDYTSKENMEKSLSTVQDVFKQALAAALTEKLRGKTPAGLGDASVSENSLRDQIARNIRKGIS